MGLFQSCHNESDLPLPVCKPNVGGIIGFYLIFVALIVLFILYCRIRAMQNRVLVSRRDREDAAEAAEATPQATARPHIRVRVTEALLPHIDRVDTLPLYDPGVAGARLSQSSEAVIAGHDYFNNHRRILLDPEGNPLDDSPASTAHEERTESSSPPFKPLHVLASSGAPLGLLPPNFRSESAGVGTEQSEPLPAYPPPVYSAGSRPPG